VFLCPELASIPGSHFVTGHLLCSTLKDIAAASAVLPIKHLLQMDEHAPMVVFFKLGILF